MDPTGQLEAIVSAQVALYDGHEYLEQHQTKRYAVRPTSAIDLLVLHKSGADGPPGFRGLEASTRFCIHQRGWPGCPYTFWASREPDIDETGRYVVYRGQPDEVRSYHTGGAANGRGIALAFQGAFDGQWDLLASGRPKIEVEPTLAQRTILADFVPWLLKKYQIPNRRLSGHWEAKRWGAKKNKLVCPGDAIRQWVLDYRHEGAVTTAPPPAPADGGWVYCPSVRDLQKALALLGWDPGPIDGIWGYRSRHALERFQSSVGLEADGWYGVRSAGAMRDALAARGLLDKDVFDVHEVK